MKVSFTSLQCGLLLPACSGIVLLWDVLQWKCPAAWVFAMGVSCNGSVLHSPAVWATSTSME
jgi:hypothetical protein